ncbi:N-acetyltransferase family protein [Chryseomicrobium sp. FSL W7-1435]|uniref:GNAT family N-acetyltransferase n=1 Tax=Chryseomicrobium sp. FSL W7-1435 TaxID=2921704 RepID=UPI0031599E89
MIRELRKEDWPAVKAIFEQGIASGNATFRTEAPTWEQWDTFHHDVCRFVFEQEGVVLGYAALFQAFTASFFHGVGEVSIYMSNEAAGKGIGSQLLAKLIETSETSGFWTLQAMIFPENQASLKLHEKFGFTEVGVRRQIGKMNDTWRDVVLIERRSKTNL